MKSQVYILAKYVKQCLVYIYNMSKLLDLGYKFMEKNNKINHAFNIPLNIICFILNHSLMLVEKKKKYIKDRVITFKEHI